MRTRCYLFAINCFNDRAQGNSVVCYAWAVDLAQEDVVGYKPFLPLYIFSILYFLVNILLCCWILHDPS